MSQLVIGVAASHSTIMNTNWDAVSDQAGPLAFRDGLEEARARLERAQPDTIIVVGSNHFRGMFLDLMPSFTIGVGECSGTGEADTPAGPLPVDQALAREIAFSLSAADFDIAFSLRLNVDHGITHGLQYLVPTLDIPIVPIVVNSFAPPLPSLKRCVSLGGMLRESVAGDGQDRRIAVVASGGLSHNLPWPKWFNASSDQDRFLVEAFLEGRNDWQKYDDRRRTITRSGEARINPSFDRACLDALRNQDLAKITSYTNEEFEELAGNGGQEIRSWLIAAAALGGAVETLAYAPVPEWLTGMGVAVMSSAGNGSSQREGLLS
jgi:2,3-dihydroxyphenylpropionate 1,2-dioxygenase